MNQGKCQNIRLNRILNLFQVYPYLVVNDANLTEARREERVLQLLRMMNHFLTKQKETSQRLLYFTVPRVVAVAPQMRLVEDNPASTSLLDIFKQVGKQHRCISGPALSCTSTTFPAHNSVFLNAIICCYFNDSSKIEPIHLTFQDSVSYLYSLYCQISFLMLLQPGDF